MALPGQAAYVLRGAVTVAALRVTGLVLGLAVALILGQTLGVSGYGAYAAAIGLASIFSVLVTVGAPLLLVRGTVAHLDAGDLPLLGGLLRRTLQAVLLISCVVAGALALVLLGLGGDSPVTAAMITATPLIVLFALGALGQAVLQGLRRMAAAHAPNTVIRPLCFLAILGFLVLIGTTPSPAGAVALQVLASGAALLVLVGLLRRALPAGLATAVPRYDTATWARSALNLGLSTGLTTISASIGVTLASALGSAREAGLLGAATRASVLVLVIAWASNQAFAPAIARLHAEGDAGRLQREVTTITRSVASVTIVIAGLLSALASPALGAFGAGFADGADSLRLLCLAAVINALAAPNMMLLQMTGHERSATAAAAAGLAGTVAVSVALIPSRGAAGAAVGILAGTLARNVVASRRTRSRLDVESTVVGRRARAA